MQIIDTLKNSWMEETRQNKLTSNIILTLVSVKILVIYLRTDKIMLIISHR